MPEFNAHNALHQAAEQHERASGGDKLVPIAAAVIAVFAALATLFSNHSSVAGLEKRTLAGIYQTRAADSYNYYESSRIKIEVNQSLLQGGVVPAAGARSAMSGRVATEEAKSEKTLAQARAFEQRSTKYLDDAEHSMASYEKYEMAATLFEVSVVLVSVTALMRTRTLLYIGAGATIVGLVFFVLGLTA